MKMLARGIKYAACRGGRGWQGVKAVSRGAHDYDRTVRPEGNYFLTTLVGDGPATSANLPHSLSGEAGNVRDVVMHVGGKRRTKPVRFSMDRAMIKGRS